MNYYMNVTEASQANYYVSRSESSIVFLKM
jgi:hypothetical protein